MKREVDGFQITAVPYFFEDEALRDEPKKDLYTFGLPESTALLYVFRKYIDDWVSTHNKTTSKYDILNTSKTSYLQSYYQYIITLYICIIFI